MRNVLALQPHPDADPGPQTARFPSRMLAELLALNEEMVEQLCLERLSMAGTAEILTGLIDQHEKTAGLLRAQLAGRGSEYPALVGLLQAAD